MRILRSRPTATIHLIVLFLTMACSRAPEVLDAVPASATTIVKFNLKRILAEADCEVTDQGIRLSPYLKTEMDTASAETRSKWKALLAAKGVDITNVIYFEQKDAEGGLLLLAAYDEDLLIESLSADSLGFVKGNDSGFTIFQEDKNSTVAIDDGYCWISFLDIDRTTSLIKKARRAAKKEPFADTGWKADELSDDVAICAITDVGEAFRDFFGDESYDKASLVITSGDGDSVLDLNARVCDADGNRKNILPSLGTIDTDFLRFASARHNVIAAFSIADDFDWDKLLKADSNSISSGNKIFLSMMEEHLRNIDGTIAVALNLDITNLNSDSLEYQVVAKMKDGGADALIAQIRQMAAEQKQHLAERNGFILLPVDGKPVRIGKVDNYLIVANHEVSTAESNHFSAASFAGKSAVIAAHNIYSDPLLSFTLSATDDEASLSVKVNNTSRGSLAEVIKIFLKESRMRDNSVKSLFGGENPFNDEDAPDDYGELLQFNDTPSK